MNTSLSFASSASSGRTKKRPLFAPPALLAAAVSPSHAEASPEVGASLGAPPGVTGRTLPGSSVQIPYEILKKLQKPTRIGGDTASGPSSKFVKFSPAVAAIDVSNPETFVEDPSDPGRRPKALQGLTANQIAELFGFRAAQGAISAVPAIGNDPQAKRKQAKHAAQTVDFTFAKGFPYVTASKSKLASDFLIFSSFGVVTFDAFATGAKPHGNAPGRDFLIASLIKLIESTSSTATPGIWTGGADYGPIFYEVSGQGSIRTTDEDLFGYRAIDRLAQVAGSQLAMIVGMGLSGLPEENQADGSLGLVQAPNFQVDSFFGGRLFGLWGNHYLYRVRAGESLVDIARYFEQPPSSIPDLVRENPHLPMVMRDGLHVPVLAQGDVLRVPTSWILRRAPVAGEILPDVRRSDLSGAGGTLGDDDEGGGFFSNLFDTITGGGSEPDAGSGGGGGGGSSSQPDGDDAHVNEAFDEHAGDPSSPFPACQQDMTSDDCFRAKGGADYCKAHSADPICAQKTAENNGKYPTETTSSGNPCKDDPYSYDCFVDQGGDHFCESVTVDGYTDNEACKRYYTGVGQTTPAKTEPAKTGGGKTGGGKTTTPVKTDTKKTPPPVKTDKKTVAPAAATSHKTAYIVGGVATALALAGGGYYVWRKKHPKVPGTALAKK